MIKSIIGSRAGLYKHLAAANMSYMSYKSYRPNGVLDGLFGAQAKVLKLFFHHPQLALSAEEVAKRAGIKMKAGRAIVRDFVRLGILKKANHSDGKKKKK